MASEDKSLDPKAESPGLNNQIKQAVKNQSVVKPEDYSEPAGRDPKKT